MEVNKRATTDRISELPEFIVHHIISFLDSPVELVRISVLSKKWSALTASFPILVFDIDKMKKILHPNQICIDDVEECKHVMAEFHNYMAYTMSRFCEQNVTAHTFKLIVGIQEYVDVYLVERWIDLIVETDIKVLRLDFTSWPLTAAEAYYDEPDLPLFHLHATLDFAPSLTSLTLRGCSLKVYNVKFKWLKLLSLHTIQLDERMIKYLTTHCPLLEEFNVERCYGFKRFCVDGLQNLQKVKIFYRNEVERIDIEAPNLHDLCLGDWHRKGAPRVNVSSCKKLRTLSFHEYVYSTSNQFAGFLSNFPFIETLYLNISNSKTCSNLKFSSRLLRRLVLYAECDLEGIEMDTPNLLLFKYSGISHKTWFSFPCVSAHFNKCMEYNPDGIVDAFWFQKLRRFLDKKKGFKVLKLHIKGSMDVEELKVIQYIPFELEHVELKLEPTTTLSSHVAVVNGVFWCCRPRSITLISNFRSIDSEEWSHVVRLTYEMLLQQEDREQSNIQIRMSSESKTKKHSSNLHALLATLPRDELVEITFTKGEGKCASQSYTSLMSA